MNWHFVYVLQSEKDGKWYTGYTDNLENRIIDHNKGQVYSTKHRTPFKLIYYESSVDKYDALAREKYLKSGIGKRYLKNRLKRYLENL
jgi:putative endonuclease